MKWCLSFCSSTECRTFQLQYKRCAHSETVQKTGDSTGAGSVVDVPVNSIDSSCSSRVVSTHSANCAENHRDSTVARLGCGRLFAHTATSGSCLRFAHRQGHDGLRRVFRRILRHFRTLFQPSTAYSIVGRGLGVLESPRVVLPGDSAQVANLDRRLLWTFTVTSVNTRLKQQPQSNTTTIHNSPQQSTTVHNSPQQSTTVHNNPQQSTTIHNQPQSTTTNHNQPQPTTTNHNQPQPTTTNHNQPQPTTTNDNNNNNTTTIQQQNNKTKIQQQQQQQQQQPSPWVTLLTREWELRSQRTLLFGVGVRVSAGGEWELLPCPDGDFSRCRFVKLESASCLYGQRVKSDDG